MTDAAHAGPTAGTKPTDVDAVATDPVGAVEAWRQRHAARLDPVALGIAQALARRAAAQPGPTRAQMARRVAHWLAVAAAATTPPPSGPVLPSLSSLAELVDRLGRTALPSGAAHASGSPGLRRAQTPPPLKALATHGRTWSRLRDAQRLRQALAQVPAQAGPLHSARLVHRALQAMHDLAPAYLAAFVVQVDALQWLEQASGGDRAPRAPGRGSEPTRRPRKRPGAAG
jgi:Protein of unknown function (DUF2894)